MIVIINSFENRTRLAIWYLNEMIKFFLLAAGLGKRAWPLSLIEPKPLFPLDGTPLIELILDQLTQKGIDQGFINLHHKAERIAEFLKGYDNITFFHEAKLSGSKILNKAAEFLEEDYLLIINGDVFLDIPLDCLIEKLDQSKSDGVLLVREDKTKMYSSLRCEQDCYKGVESHPSAELMYTGVALLKNSIISRICEQNFFQTLGKYNFDIRVLIYDGLWLDIGDPRSYFQSNFLYKKYVNKNHDLNSLSEQVLISPDSTVEHTIIWGNTRVLNKTRISHSIITGNMTLDHLNYQNKIITNQEVYDF